MPVQGSVHNVKRAPHQTLGTRTRRRGRADAARSEPASHACAPRNRRAWPELAPGLTPDSIKQKYAQTVVSTRIVPGCVLFLGEEERFYTVWTRNRPPAADAPCPLYPQ